MSTHSVRWSIATALRDLKMSRKEWRDIWREFCDVNDVPVILSTMHEYLHTPDHVTRSFKDDLDMKVGWVLQVDRVGSWS